MLYFLLHINFLPLYLSSNMSKLFLLFQFCFLLLILIKFVSHNRITYLTFTRKNMFLSNSFTIQFNVFNVCIVLSFNLMCLMCENLRPLELYYSLAVIET